MPTCSLCGRSESNILLRNQPTKHGSAVRIFIQPYTTGTIIKLIQYNRKIEILSSPGIPVNSSQIEVGLRGLSVLPL